MVIPTSLIGAYPLLLARCDLGHLGFTCYHRCVCDSLHHALCPTVDLCSQGLSPWSHLTPAVYSSHLYFLTLSWAFCGLRLFALLFYCCLKTLRLRQLEEEKVYLSLQSCYCRGDRRWQPWWLEQQLRAHSHLEPETQSRERQLGIGKGPQLSKPASCGVPPPTKPQLLNCRPVPPPPSPPPPPDSVISRGPHAQMPGTMKDSSHSYHHRGSLQ